MTVDFAFLAVCLQSGLKYLHITLFLSLSAFAIGIILGMAVALVRVFQVRILSPALAILVTMARAIPVVLVLYMVYFLFTDTFNLVAQSLGWSLRSGDMSLLVVGVVFLSIVAVSTVSETLRGAFLSVGRAQYEAGYSVGMTTSATLRRIVIPQVLSVACPVLCSNLIALVKASSLVYLVSIIDLMNGTLLAATANYSYLTAYMAAALLYWGVNLAIEQLFRLLQALVFSRHLLLSTK